MLRFFEKYQRGFFIFVTVMVVASFAFFGVFDAVVSNDRSEEDVKIGEYSDGSPLMRSDVLRLSRFIATDRGDLMAKGHGIPNLCNDGVIRNDLLKTGISDLYVVDYFDSLKGDFSQRLERAKRYRGYENPEAPFISARSVWDRFMPSISSELDALKTDGEVSASTFSRLSHLYQEQALCPPEFVRRVLMYFAHQASWIKSDPYLPQTDLSLFGFHSLSDWFGANFVDLSAQFILNAAKEAQIKGYSVTKEEARADLLKNFHASMKKLAEMKLPATETFANHLRSLGFDENSAAEIWRNVLLFRRYFHTVGQTTFIDQMPYRDFASFSREVSLVQKYEWPSALHLKTGEDLIEFQVYLQAVSHRLNALSLPSEFLSLEAIAKETPELVQSTYKLKVAALSMEEVGLCATMKELLEWQLDETHWNLLVSTFSWIKPANSKESRFAVIDALSTENRLKIDAFARNMWAKNNSRVAYEQLQRLPSVERVVSVAQNWVSLPGIENFSQFAALLESASSGVEEVQPLLETYSDNDQIFYRFNAVEKVSDMHVLTFEEAKSLGVLEMIADRFLESEYKKIQTKYPSKFQVKDGEWKLFASVKEEVASIVLADLMKQIGGEKEPLAYYASHRLEMPAKEALNALQKNPEDPKWVRGGDANFLSEQFKLIKNECLIQRTEKDGWMKEQVFIMTPNEWSPVYVPVDGNITFFYFDKKQETQEPILEQISFGKEVIAADAQRYVAKTLLSKAKQKKTMVIPVYNKEKE
jgi:hypothetical protein